MLNICKSCKKIFVFAGSVFLSLFLFSCSKPGDSSVEKAVTFYGAGKYDQALELFNEALEKQTRYSDELIFAFISNTYAAQEDFENAALWLEKSLEKKTDYRNYVTLGMDYQTLKNYSKAEENYLKEGVNLEKAIESLKKGSELAPKIAVIHAYLGAAYFKNGQKDEAQVEFFKALELNCENLDQIKEKFGIFDE